MAVNANLLLRNFESTYILFRVNGKNQVYPWKNLIYPSLITKVYCEASTSLPIPHSYRFPNQGMTVDFSVIYDKVAKDDFAMYNTTTGQFTIPISGYWKITYTTTLIFYFPGVISNEGRFTLNCYIKKNVNDRSILSTTELSLIRDFGNNITSEPDQEVRTLENSGIVLFNKGDVFNINGLILAGFDKAHGSAESAIYLVGDPAILDGIDPFTNFTTKLLTGFKTVTECAVEFVRPINFIV